MTTSTITSSRSSSRNRVGTRCLRRSNGPSTPGHPEAERKFLAGAGAQYESEAVYHNLKKEWERLGVIFVDSDTGLREYPDIYKEHFGTVVPPPITNTLPEHRRVERRQLCLYPAGVKVDIPLQAYFRIKHPADGPVRADPDHRRRGLAGVLRRRLHRPIYSTASLHSGVIEIIIKKGARVRYTTIQNWSHNIYNLVTQRAMAHEDATMEWVDGNMGSRLTMKYPAVYMVGKGARAEILSIAFANTGQHQDTGAKVIHAAPHTTSSITAKSISRGGGRAGYRGLVKVHREPSASNRTSSATPSSSTTSPALTPYPVMEIDEENVSVSHEATVSKISDEQLFYCRAGAS